MNGSSLQIVHSTPTVRNEVSSETKLASCLSRLLDSQGYALRQCLVNDEKNIVSGLISEYEGVKAR